MRNALVSGGKSGARAAAPARRGRHARVLRIIGGEWRGRRLRFPATPALRPTPDRVRETLFNWLGSAVRGVRALDLFAGSGALGLEALSRGAAHVTFVEHDGPAARELRERLADWRAGDAQVVHADALEFLKGPPAAFQLVFLDPPFDSDLLERSARALESGGWLADSALIYAEVPARSALPRLPPTWQALKTGRAGEVGYHLLAHAAPTPTHSA